jgi:hypothetical protein
MERIEVKVIQARSPEIFGEILEDMMNKGWVAGNMFMKPETTLETKDRYMMPKLEVQEWMYSAVLTRHSPPEA